MNDKKAKKELLTQYKERQVVGGVYAVRNTVKNKLLLDFTANLTGMKNRFDFAQQTGSCVSKRIQDDWEEQKGDGFIFEVLEEIEKGETQTDREFKEDLALLLEMWNEKLSAETIY